MPYKVVDPSMPQQMTGDPFRQAYENRGVNRRRNVERATELLQ